MFEKERQELTATVKDAGELLREFWRHRAKAKVAYKAMREPVTDADIESSRLIEMRLRQAFPADAIISEEGSGDTTEVKDGEAARRTWIIDPLDGTKNFLAGIPFFAVAAVLVENNASLLSAILDPVHDELFLAVRGEGATLNGEPLMVSKRTFNEPGMLFAGSDRNPQVRQRQGELLRRLEANTPYFRRLGSASLMLAYLAAGRADVVLLSRNKKPWDTLPGDLIAREAGGITTDFQGNQWTTSDQDMLATNGLMQEGFLELLREIEL